MTVEAIARHPGVLTYYKADGSVRRELVPSDLLRGFDSNGMPLAAKLAGIPVSNEHPTALFKTLPSDRRDALKKGVVAEDGIEVYKDGSTKVRFHVTDAATQDDIRSGRKDGVSLGYEVGSVEKAGEWQGKRYDAMQSTPFEADHLAVVKYPRADQARIVRFDSEARLDDVAWQKVCDSTEVPMATIRLDSGAAHEVPEAVAIAWDSMHQDMKKKMKDYEDLEKEKEDMKEEMDSLNQTLEYIHSRVDELEAQGQNFDADAVNALVAERVDAWLDVAQMVGQPINFAASGITFNPSMDAAEVHKSLILAKSPDMKLDGMNADVVKGLYMGLFKSGKTESPRADSTNTLQAQLAAAALSGGGGRSDAQSKRQAKMDAQLKRSRQPIHATA
jgi:GTP cyclohydrolase II